MRLSELLVVTAGVLVVEGEVNISEMVLLLVVTAGVVRVLIFVKILVVNLVVAARVLVEEMTAVVL